MLKKATILLVILLLGLLTACSGDKGVLTQEELINIVWQWVDMAQKTPAYQESISNPENYTITFFEDGTASIKADCNMVGATYEMDNGSIAITLGPSTMAFCGEKSLDQLFLKSLAKVSKIGWSGKMIIMQFPDNGGQMTFKNGGPAE